MPENKSQHVNHKYNNHVPNCTQFDNSVLNFVGGPRPLQKV